MKNYDLLKVVASKLDGLQYPLREVHLKELREYCKENGIVMCFGSSDDLMELDGAIYDEYGCWNGGTICFDEKGDRADANVYYPVTAVLGKDDISWQYKFEPKHEIFTIYEASDIYCKGIVFFVDDLKRVADKKTIKVVVGGKEVFEIDLSEPIPEVIEINEDSDWNDKWGLFAIMCIFAGNVKFNEENLKELKDKCGNKGEGNG